MVQRPGEETKKLAEVRTLWQIQLPAMCVEGQRFILASQMKKKYIP